MKRVPVESESIASIGYNPRRRELDLEFRQSGAVYRYSEVSAKEHAEFMAAESKGKYLNEVFKPRLHPYRIILEGHR